MLQLPHFIMIMTYNLFLLTDRPGLKDPKSVELLQDTLLAAFQHYINESRPKTPVHWAKILMKVRFVNSCWGIGGTLIMNLSGQKKYPVSGHRSASKSVRRQN